ncbi:MAG: GNAT family N-acetyltransferase, partial [Hominenteromicrobium sp.]
PADLEAVHTYAGDPENARYMMFLPKESKADTAHFLEEIEAEWKKENPSFFEFAVLLENVLIGSVSVYLDEAHTEGELGWILNKRYWGCGYAAESAAALRDFALRTLKLPRLVAHCDARNTASARVMEKLGMTLEDDTGTRQYRNRPEIARELRYALTHTTT